MEEKDEESAFFDGSASDYNLTFELFEVSLKREESTIFDRQRLGSCRSTSRIKSFSSKSGCSKSCTKYRKISSNGPQTSACEPQALRESSYRQKKPETKLAGEMPLFGQLKAKMKETPRKLQVPFCISPSPKYFCTHESRRDRSIDNFQQSALPFFKRTTRHAAAKVRSLYDGLRAKRVLGFKCDLKKCDSTLVDCSAGACKKKSMIFGEFSQPCVSKTAKSSVSDISTVSNADEDKF